MVLAAVPLVVLAATLLIAFSGCSFDPGSAGLTFDQAVLAEASVVSFWHLGEPGGPVAADSKDGHNGTYLNGPLPDDPADFSAGAPGTLTFDQSSLISNTPAKRSIFVNGGRVEVPFTPELNTATFTVLAWVRTAWTAGDEPAYRCVLDSRDQLASGEKQGYAIFANPTSHWEAWVGDGTASQYKIASTGAPISLGTTDYLVATCDGATLTLYVNGELRASVATAFGPNAARKLYIGEGAPMLPTPFFPFVGQIAEVAYFNTALDQQAVVDIGMGSA
ncbi:MAG: hypothetical protein QOE36_3066 [Gaiellaceae bacterium]|jgi:hypothetical protein|nr:hypothetical protein [Gaiellaceae bacterium]